MIIKHTTVSCTHCGLPVPSGLIDPASDEQFCCGGCQGAWSLIHECGLDSFYKMADSASDRRTLSTKGRDQASANSFAEFDEPGFLQKFSIQGPQENKIKLSIHGMHCTACVWLIEKLPAILPGVISTRVNWARQTVELTWNPQQVTLSSIGMFLNRLGYSTHPIRQAETVSRRESENRRQLVQIGIAAAAAGNNMIIAAALYLGMFAHMTAGMESFLRAASCLVGLASFLGPGRVFLRGAFNALRAQTPHMDLPIAVGLTVGSVAGLINTVRGVGEIYFDSLSVLICLLLVGRWIQFRQQNRAADAVDMLFRLTPQRARKVQGASIVDVSVDDLSVGDLIEVPPGEPVAVDGTILTGDSRVDESILTGESRHVRKTTGDTVSAGTRNISSPVRVTVSAIGSHTRLGGIMDLVENATSQKPKIVQWADRIGGHFVVAILILAAATFVAWLLIDATRAVDRAVALLIVACPCALAMATPLAIAVALGRLANRKILIKSGDVLQSLSKPGIVWLDKTGTLTEGKLTITRWYGDRSCLASVKTVETKFTHPVARALVDFASSSQEAASSDNQIKEPVIENIRSVNGGIAALVDGRAMVVGNRVAIEDSDVRIDDQWQEFESEILANGQSPCWFSWDGQIVALASVGDRVRPEAAESVSQLKKDGWRVGILSGDHPLVVQSVAKQLKIDLAQAGVTPEQKLDVIRDSIKGNGPTVMVGDGVNDSAALAAATVGIAVEGGAEASLVAAPVYLGSGGLGSISELLQASQSTTRTIRTNFAASLGFNIVGVTLAAVGWLDPLVAAILMPISSLTVLALSTNAAGK
jgi:Cu2+-exporting ATPase